MHFSIVRERKTKWNYDVHSYIKQKSFCIEFLCCYNAMSNHQRLEYLNWTNNSFKYETIFLWFHFDIQVIFYEIPCECNVLRFRNFLKLKTISISITQKRWLCRLLKILFQKLFSCLLKFAQLLQNNIQFFALKNKTRKI